MLERLPPSLQQAYEAVGDRTLNEAARIARGVHRAGRTLTAREPPAVIAEIKQAERVALRVWAESCSVLSDDRAFTEQWKAQGRISGQENDVLLDGGLVRKRNNLTFHLTYVDFFDRLALHNLLFPGAPVKFEGFTTAPDFPPIFSQPFVLASRGARRDEVKRFMARAGYARIRGDDYRNREGILVEDVHDENAFIDEFGNLIVVDPVIYVADHRPRSKTGSSSSKHPSRKSLRP